MLLSKDLQQLLGLASRARQIATGSQVLNAVRKQQTKLVLYASDASQNSIKQIVDKCRYYKVTAIAVEDSELLSRAIGKSGRVAVAVLSDGFAKKMLEKLGVGEKNGEDETKQIAK